MLIMIGKNFTQIVINIYRVVFFNNTKQIFVLRFKIIAGGRYKGSAY